jgi:hypothetical protein
VQKEMTKHIHSYLVGKNYIHALAHKITLLFRWISKLVKSIVYMMLIIQPWPPQDFGLLVDGLMIWSYGKRELTYAGMEKDAFTMFSKTIFGNDVLNDANLTLRVISVVLFILQSIHLPLYLSHSK